MNDARAGLSWSVATLAFWVTWFSATAFHLPLCWYYPLEQRWVFGPSAPGLAACIYGQLFLSIPIAGLAGALTWALVGKRTLPKAQGWLSAGWCTVLLCFVIGYFAFALYGRPLMSNHLPPLPNGG